MMRMIMNQDDDEHIKVHRIEICKRKNNSFFYVLQETLCL